MTILLIIFWYLFSGLCCAGTFLTEATGNYPNRTKYQACLWLLIFWPVCAMFAVAIASIDWEESKKI
jgi:hypothetical protein